MYYVNLYKYHVLICGWSCGKEAVIQTVLDGLYTHPDGWGVQSLHGARSILGVVSAWVHYVLPLLPHWQ